MFRKYWVYGLSVSPICSIRMEGKVPHIKYNLREFKIQIVLKKKPTKYIEKLKNY